MIFRSPHPDVSIPSVPLTPFVLERARERGRKAALIDGPTGRVTTYAELVGRIERTAAGLARRGLRKGDVVGLCARNSPDYVVAFHAISLAGGVVTTANPLSTGEELARQLRDGRARYLVAMPDGLEAAREGAAGSFVEELLVLGRGDGAVPFASLEEGGGRPPEVEIDPSEDLVALPYSSGTTGFPKGVMLTHRNLVANVCQVEGAGTGLSDRDTLIGVLPFYHIYGMLAIVSTGLHLGTTIVTLPRFELEAFLLAMERHGVTFAHLVPPIILALARHPKVARHDLSKLRMIQSGAAPLAAELARECSERLGCLVAQGYGLTETSPVTHCNPGDPARIKLGSIGPCVPNTECKVVDAATGAELGPGGRGEIRIRGPQVMKGYLGRPDATAEVLDGEGWLRTGDVGYADEEGYFYIVDRAKELIKYKGFQVAPAELEALLLSHPAVADAAVIPSPDEEAGEVPKAFVVLKGEASESLLLDWVSRRVAPYKKIRRLEFVGEIPKSPSGKILRRVLVERERAGR